MGFLGRVAVVERSDTTGVPLPRPVQLGRPAPGTLPFYPCPPGVEKEPHWDRCRRLKLRVVRPLGEEQAGPGGPTS